jgi:hypothetical protein
MEHHHESDADTDADIDDTDLEVLLGDLNYEMDLFEFENNQYNETILQNYNELRTNFNLLINDYEKLFKMAKKLNKSKKTVCCEDCKDADFVFLTCLFFTVFCIIICCATLCHTNILTYEVFPIRRMELSQENILVFYILYISFFFLLIYLFGFFHTKDYFYLKNSFPDLNFRPFTSNIFLLVVILCQLVYLSHKTMYFYEEGIFI